MSKHWEVHGSNDPDPTDSVEYMRAHRRNVTGHVVCATAQRAIELMIEKHPTLSVHSVHHRGAIDIIEDKP